jgi:hypothetical protein
MEDAIKDDKTVDAMKEALTRVLEEDSTREALVGVMDKVVRSYGPETVDGRVRLCAISRLLGDMISSIPVDASVDVRFLPRVEIQLLRDKLKGPCKGLDSKVDQYLSSPEAKRLDALAEAGKRMTTHYGTKVPRPLINRSTHDKVMGACKQDSGVWGQYKTDDCTYEELEKWFNTAFQTTLHKLQLNALKEGKCKPKKKFNWKKGRRVLLPPKDQHCTKKELTKAIDVPNKNRLTHKEWEYLFYLLIPVVNLSYVASEYDKHIQEKIQAYGEGKRLRTKNKRSNAWKQVSKAWPKGNELKPKLVRSQNVGIEGTPPFELDAVGGSQNKGPEIEMARRKTVGENAESPKSQDSAYRSDVDESKDPLNPNS